MRDGTNHSRAAALSLVASAVVLALAYGSSMWIDEVHSVGPFDRAVLGGFITLPLVIGAPMLAALAARALHGKRWRWIGLGTLGVFAFGTVASAVGLGTSYLGCGQISDPGQTLPGSAIVGMTAGIGLVVAASLADSLGRRSGGHPAIATLLVGATLGLAASVLTLFAWSALFPAVLCAPTA